MVAAEPKVKSLTLTLLSGSVSRVRETSEAISGMASEYSNIKLSVFDFKERNLLDKISFAVVVDLETWTPTEESIIEDLRKLGYKGPVIVLTKRVSQDIEAGLSNKKMIFFDRTKGVEEFQKLLRSILNDVLVRDRKHQRHAVNQLAQIRLPGRKDLLTVRVKNISEGGAFLEADVPLLLIKGDEIGVRIRLPHLKKIHMIASRVAWVRKNSVGVQFLEKKQD